MSNEPTRTYTNGEIIVEWRQEKCIHCTTCVSTLPEVFNLEARPWVNMQGSTTEKIRSTVAMCPSGALALREVQSANQSSEESQ